MPTPANTTTPLLAKPAIPHMTTSYLSSIHQYLPEPDYPNLTCQAFPNLTSTRPAVNLHAFPNLPHRNSDNRYNPQQNSPLPAPPNLPYHDSTFLNVPCTTYAHRTCHYMPFCTPRCLDSPFLSCQSTPRIALQLRKLTLRNKPHQPKRASPNLDRPRNSAPATSEEGH